MAKIPEAPPNNFKLHFISQLLSIGYTKESVKCSFGWAHCNLQENWDSTAQKEVENGY